MQESIHRLGRNSPRLKELRRRIRQRQKGEVLLDGRRLLQDALRWKIPLREIYLSESALRENPDPVFDEIPTFLIDDEVFRKLAPTRNSQGFLVFVDEPEFPEWRAAQGLGLYLEGVQDPLNVGAIIRSAAGFGAEAVWLSPGCADPFGPRAVRSSAGAVFRIGVEREVPLEGALARARSGGCRVWATGADGMAVGDWAPDDPLLLLLGSEGPGLSTAAMEGAEGVLSIELDREIESLNVAVAAGVLLSRIRAILRPR